MKTKTLLRILLGLLVAALIAGVIYVNSLMCIITGYAAKNLCSAVFVSGRNADSVEQLDLNFSFIRFTRNKVDYEAKTVTSRFLWGKSVAVCRDGFGATLLCDANKDAFRRQAFPLQLRPPYNPDTACWPLGDRIADSLVDSACVARLAPIAKAFIDDQAYNGTPFAFVVLHHGVPVAERYRKGFDAHTRLLSWSMAKSFTNAIAGLMASDGMIDIYAPMDIPQWQDDGRKAITLNSLMQMQSGLEWNESYGSRSDVNFMLHREADMGRYAMEKPLEYQPNTHWYYSSGSSNIVCRYLKERFPSDSMFYAYIWHRLFYPIGITTARFEVDMAGTPVGSSYLYATARDYARFGQLFLDKGRFAGRQVFPAEWVDYSVTAASDSKGKYGAFFWLNRGGSLPDVPRDMFACDGHDGQQIYIIPSKDLVVVVLGYSPKPDRVIDFNRLLADVMERL